MYTENDVDKAIYAVYLRKSRADIDAEKRGEGETLARHEKILLAVAEEQNLKIGKVYKELVSGETIQARPQMQELLKEINAGKFAGVLVVAADRLSRGDLQNMGLILNAFKFSETLLVTPGKTYDVANNKFDEQMLEMQLFNSKQEYRAIVGRMHEGRLLSVREGNYISSTIPFGYDLYQPDRWTRTLKPNKDADIVREIFHLAGVEGMSSGAIAKLLTQRGIKPIKKAKEWQRETVRDILKNPVYIGKVRWKKVPLQKEMDEEGKVTRRYRHSNKPMITEGKHPAIIPLELWEQAQASFKKMPPPKHSDTELKNPLAGLLKCEKCGRAMRYAYRRRTNPSYYHTDYTVCQTVGVYAETVFSLLVQALNEYIEDFSFKVDNADKMEEMKRHTAEIERLEKEIKEAQKKRMKLFDDYDDGLYSREEFAERKEVWADRISQMSSRLEDLKNSTPEEIDYAEKVYKFSQAVSSIKDKNAPASAKNAFLKDIVTRIDFYAEGDKKKPKITLNLHIK